MNKTNKLITLTRIDETKLYVNINHISAFYYSNSWEYTIVLLVGGTQLDVKDSVESITEYFQSKVLKGRLKQTSGYTFKYRE